MYKGIAFLSGDKPSEKKLYSVKNFEIVII